VANITTDDLLARHRAALPRWVNPRPMPRRGWRSSRPPSH